MKTNAIFTIFKKELSRFFKDRRTLTALLLPGILIYVIYSLMGGMLTDSMMSDEEFKPYVAVSQLPGSLRLMFEDSGLFYVSEADTADKISAYKNQISDGMLDLLILFPESFDQEVAAYDPTTGAFAPNVQIYYNSSDSDSTTAYQIVVALFDQYEASMANKFDINRPSSENLSFDLASEEDLTAMVFSMLMPMLLVMLLFSGCMAVAPESIAGEKERGTIASLLITPTKRSHIAIGKILALSIMALLSGISSTLGVILSLPKLMGSDVTLDGSVYAIADYAMLGVVILSTVLFLITLISIISAFAKTVKEATSYVTPLMVLSMVIGLSGMFGTSTSTPYLYAIPLYNSVQSMIGIFSFEPNILHMVITVVSNVLWSVLGVFVLTRMFNSEKVMFNK